MGNPAEEDRYHIDPEKIPAGASYEWRTWSILGEIDNMSAFRLTRAGWTPVPADRHPELKAPGTSGDTIIIDGMILMERPKEKTEEAQKRERELASEMVAAIQKEGAKSAWEPPIEKRLSDAEKEVARICFPQLVDGNDATQAYANYERNKDQERRLKERYGFGVSFHRQRAIELALKAPATVIDAAGGLIRLAGEIEGYLKEPS